MLGYHYTRLLAELHNVSLRCKAGLRHCHSKVLEVQGEIRLTDEGVAQDANAVRNVTARRYVCTASAIAEVDDELRQRNIDSILRFAELESELLSGRYRAVLAVDE